MIQSWLPVVGISVAGLTFAGVGLIPLYFGRKIRKRNKEVEATETTAISDLQPGTARIEGTARPIEGESHVQAVMADREGLARSFDIANFNMRGNNAYESIHVENEAVPFHIEDGTSAVRVDPPTSEVSISSMSMKTIPPTDGRYVLETVEQTEVPTNEDPPDTIRQYEAEHEVDSATQYEVAGIEGSYRRRYLEGLLEPDDTVIVRGEIQQGEGWDEPDYVVKGETDPESFLLSNKPVEEVVQEDSVKGMILYWGGLLAVIGGLVGAVISSIAWLFVSVV